MLYVAPMAKASKERARLVCGCPARLREGAQRGPVPFPFPS